MRPFAIEDHFVKWEFSARFHMTASDAESLSIDELLAMAPEASRSDFARFWMGYTETMGHPALRQEIAATYENMEAENILCFTGAQEGIYATMRVLLGRDDHVIVAVPNYQAAETLPLALCSVTGVALRPDCGWHIDIDELEAAIRPNTKLISVNFPNNPTGAIIPRADFMRLAAICDRRGIYLFCDEVYRLLEIDEAKRLPQAADICERGLSLNGLSKAYGLPGLRIGWLASPDRELLRCIDGFKHYLSICNAGPSEFFGQIALAASERILSRNRGLMRNNLAVLDGFFARHPDLFEWSRPDGGCVGFPRFLGRGGVDSLCQRLVEEDGVLLMPASIFRSELMDTPEDRFRIGFGRRGIEAGLAAFEQHLQRRHNDIAA